MKKNLENLEKDIVYRDLNCILKQDTYSTYLQLKRNEDLDKAIEYGFSFMKNAYCLDVRSAKDFIKTSSLPCGFNLGYFEFGKKKVYAIEIITKELFSNEKIPVFCKLTKKEYTTETFSMKKVEKRGILCEGKEGKSQYFSKYDA